MCEVPDDTAAKTILAIGRVTQPVVLLNTSICRMNW